MRSPIDDVIFEWASLPDGDPRKEELEFQIRWAEPGRPGLIKARRIEARIGRALMCLLNLAGFGWLRPWLIEILRGKVE